MPSANTEIEKPHLPCRIHGRDDRLMRRLGIGRNNQRQIFLASGLLTNRPLQGIQPIIDQPLAIYAVGALRGDGDIDLSRRMLCHFATSRRQRQFQMTLLGKRGRDHKEYQQEKNHINEWRQVNPDLVVPLSLEFQDTPL